MYVCDGLTLPVIMVYLKHGGFRYLYGSAYLSKGGDGAQEAGVKSMKTEMRVKSPVKCV